MSAHGSAMRAVAASIIQHGVVYTIHRRTGEIQPCSLDEYRAVMAQGFGRMYVVRATYRQALAVQAKIDRSGKEN